MWTAGIVVMTLLVNAPLIPLLLKWTGLSQVSKVKTKIRAKAARAFSRYTENAVDELKNDEDEMLRGKLGKEVVLSMSVHNVYTVCAQLNVKLGVLHQNMHAVSTHHCASEYIHIFVNGGFYSELGPDNEKAGCSCHTL